MGALSPGRRPNLVIRVYPPGRVAYRVERVSNNFGRRVVGGVNCSGFEGRMVGFEDDDDEDEEVELDATREVA